MLMLSLFYLSQYSCTRFMLFFMVFLRVCFVLRSLGCRRFVVYIYECCQDLDYGLGFIFFWGRCLLNMAFEVVVGRNVINFRYENVRGSRSLEIWLVSCCVLFFNSLVIVFYSFLLSLSLFYYFYLVLQYDFFFNMFNLE